MNRAAGEWYGREICDIGVRVIALDDSANVSDVVGEARQDEIGVVGRVVVPQHRPSHQDVVAGEGHEHGVFDVVIQGVAVADAFQCEPGGIGRNSASRAWEEPNLLLVSDARNDPKACATSSGIVII
jgi:hypothetical protein